MHSCSWSTREEWRRTRCMWMIKLRTKLHTRWWRHHRYAMHTKCLYGMVTTGWCSMLWWRTVRCRWWGNEITDCLTIRGLTTRTKKNIKSKLFKFICDATCSCYEYRLRRKYLRCLASFRFSHAIEYAYWGGVMGNLLRARHLQKIRNGEYCSRNFRTERFTDH